MDVKSTILLSGEVALQRQLDVTANNIANMNTTGFKREAPVFHQYVENLKDVPVPTSGAKVANYVLDYGTTHDITEGAFKATGSPFDFMINGAGYFGIRMADGTIAYTRNGHFELNQAGVMVDSAGREVVGADGQPIQIDPASKNAVSVAPNGAVEGPQGQIAQIGVFQFGDEAFAEQRGDGLFNASGQTPVAAPGNSISLKVGGLEASNVSGVVETAHLVEIQRRYQASVNMTQDLNDMQKSAIQRLGHTE